MADKDAFDLWCGMGDQDRATDYRTMDARIPMRADRATVDEAVRT
jgi:hypothetical protein